jgi:hypothetical protein
MTAVAPVDEQARERLKALFTNPGFAIGAAAPILTGTYIGDAPAMAMIPQAQFKALQVRIAELEAEAQEKDALIKRLDESLTLKRSVIHRLEQDVRELESERTALLATIEQATIPMAEPIVPLILLLEGYQLRPVDLVPGPLPQPGDHCVERLTVDGHQRFNLMNCLSETVVEGRQVLLLTMLKEAERREAA